MLTRGDSRIIHLVLHIGYALKYIARLTMQCCNVQKHSVYMIDGVQT